MMDLFSTLIVLVVSQMYTHVKIYWIALFGYLQLTVCHYILIKLFKNSIWPWTNLLTCKVVMETVNFIRLFHG